MPHYDVLSADSDGRSVLVQVKAIRRGNWQFNARQYIDVRFGGDRLTLREAMLRPVPALACVFVLLGGSGKNRFLVFPWLTLATIISSQYRAHIERKHGVRPKKPRSLHIKLRAEDLVRFENRWDLITAEPATSGPSRVSAINR